LGEGGVSNYSLQNISGELFNVSREDHDADKVMERILPNTYNE
jgi:hypothetical protein